MSQRRGPQVQPEEAEGRGGPRAPCPRLFLSRPLLTPVKQGWGRLAWQCIWEVAYVQISKKKKKVGGACPLPPAAPSPKDRQQKQGGAAILLHPSCMAVEGGQEAVGEVGSVPARSHPGGSSAGP